MSYTKEQMIGAFLAGFGAEWTVDPRAAAETHAEHVMSAPRIAPEAATTNEPVSLYLPPVGTPEDVLARAVASLMCRTFMALGGDVNPTTVFTADWYWPTMDALRDAYPVLGAVEDAKAEKAV